MRLEHGAFERAVLAYGLDPVELPGDLLEAGRASLDSTGLFLVGELHRAAENPRVILALARELGTRGLALEWSHDAGAYHAQLERVKELEPLGVRVRRELPGLDAVQVLFDEGEVWFHGPTSVGTPTDWPGRELRLPSATPADVPWRKHM